MKRKKQTALSLALGSALSASLASTPAAAQGQTSSANPFGAHSLERGYMVAQAQVKQGSGRTGQTPNPDAEANRRMMQEGKCGEGMCGSKHAKEGKCGSSKAKSGKPPAAKGGEGRCGAKR